MDPAALAAMVFGPGIRAGGDVHEERGDVIEVAVFFVAIGADAAIFEDTVQPGFLPRFLESGFAGRLAEFDASFGNHPALAATRVNQTDTAFADWDGSCLKDEGRLRHSMETRNSPGNRLSKHGSRLRVSSMSSC